MYLFLISIKGNFAKSYKTYHRYICNRSLSNSKITVLEFSLGSTKFANLSKFFYFLISFANFERKFLVLLSNLIRIRILLTFWSSVTFHGLFTRHNILATFSLVLSKTSWKNYSLQHSNLLHDRKLVVFRIWKYLFYHNSYLIGI